MASALIWQAPTTWTEQPGSPDWKRNYITNVDRVFKGQYKQMITVLPVQGMFMQDLGQNYRVDTVQLIAEQIDGIGTLRLSLSDWATQMNPIYECDWTEQQRPLIAHPRYASVGAKALTTTDVRHIAAWKNSCVASQLALKYDITDATGAVTSSPALSSNAQDYAAKCLSNGETYRVWLPVVRSKTYQYNPAFATPGGKSVGAPPGAPGGYYWVRGPMRPIWLRKYWELQTEYMGFDSPIDTSIYPT